MKRFFKNLIVVVFILLASGFIFSGCAESRYHRRYHHHTREWYGRHHRPVPPGVNFEIDVRR